MENKLRYVYQLSLSDGKVLINECDGLFSVNNPEDPEDKVLINSAVLIKMLEVEPEMEVQETPLEPSHDQLVDQATEEYLDSVNVEPVQEAELNQ